MSHSSQRHEALLRLGIEELPPLMSVNSNESDASSSTSEHICEQLSFLSIPARERPVPGRRCPACLSRGATVWVCVGKRCPQCGTEVN